MKKGSGNFEEKQRLRKLKNSFFFPKKTKKQVVVLKRFAPPEVVEKAVESAKAFRAGRGPQSAAARPAKKG